ncbi:Uncharacterised protein [Candidatus Gugararchaeum adminiculabundum]|nr:Uncharacterised protein [Candidatus Gugararchaeum adminiculabundum]
MTTIALNAYNRSPVLVDKAKRFPTDLLAKITEKYTSTKAQVCAALNGEQGFVTVKINGKPASQEEALKLVKAARKSDVKFVTRQKFVPLGSFVISRKSTAPAEKSLSASIRSVSIQAAKAFASIAQETLNLTLGAVAKVADKALGAIAFLPRPVRAVLTGVILIILAGCGGGGKSTPASVTPTDSNVLQKSYKIIQKSYANPDAYHPLLTVDIQAPAGTAKAGTLVAYENSNPLERQGVIINYSKDGKTHWAYAAPAVGQDGKAVFVIGTDGQPAQQFFSEGEMIAPDKAVIYTTNTATGKMVAIVIAPGSTAGTTQVNLFGIGDDFQTQGLVSGAWFSSAFANLGFLFTGHSETADSAKFTAVVTDINGAQLPLQFRSMFGGNTVPGNEFSVPDLIQLDDNGTMKRFVAGDLKLDVMNLGDSPSFSMGAASELGDGSQNIFRSAADVITYQVKGKDEVTVWIPTQKKQ